MSTKAIAAKLMIKGGDRVLLRNAPTDYTALLEPLPEGATLSVRARGSFDLIQIFVRSQDELARELAALAGFAGPTTRLWVTYPKLSSKLKGDINRDSIAAFARTVGFEGVSIIAIDDDWSALRLKRKEE
jgi:hypothetical protein